MITAALGKLPKDDSEPLDAIENDFEGEEEDQLEVDDEVDENENE